MGHSIIETGANLDAPAGEVRSQRSEGPVEPAVPFPAAFEPAEPILNTSIGRADAVTKGAIEVVIPV